MRLTTRQFLALVPLTFLRVCLRQGVPVRLNRFFGFGPLALVPPTPHRSCYLNLICTRFVYLYLYRLLRKSRGNLSAPLSSFFACLLWRAGPPVSDSILLGSVRGGVRVGGPEHTIA